MENQTLQAALKYHAAGWAVLDIPHATKAPTHKQWQNIRYNAEQVKRVFGKGKPRNIGVLQGAPSGNLADVDLDCQEARDLAPHYLPKTPAVFGRDGSPRSHWLYVLNEACDTAQHKAADKSMIVELRSTGAQTVFPPSVHPSGERIRWESDAGEPAHVDADELRTAVERLADAVRRQRGERPHNDDRQSAGGTTRDVLLRAAERYVAKVPPAAEGGRNAAAFGLAGHLAAFQTDTGERLDEDTILGLLRQWNERCTTPLPDHELRTAVHSAMTNGTPREPHIVQTGAGGEYDGPLGWDGTPDGQSDQPRMNVKTKKLNLPPMTDTGLAERFAKQHAGKARYCYKWKKWLAWDYRRWAIDDGGIVESLAKDTARSILREAAAEQDDDRRKALVRFARSAESASRRAAMLRLAQSEEGIPIAPEKLDADPWLLNCLNGTLDLRTGTLRKHSPTDLITKLAPVAHNPDADAPTWHTVRSVALAGRSSLDTFLRRLAGYCLTGIVRDQVLPIFHGTGANGKSTIINALLDVLGEDYSLKAPAELLMATRGEHHPTERADLHGKRLIAAVETGEGRRLAEALVKELTGGDRIRARRMREDFWEFAPTHKVILATNHKPEIRGTDHAIWRRLKLVPFTVCIPDAEQDKSLPEKLKAELPGILAWAVQGCMDWQKHGLGEPEEVRAATAEYRNDQDILGAFIAECCIQLPDVRARAADLLAAYQTWAGDTRMTQTRLGRALAERGYGKRSSGGYVWWLGIGLEQTEL